MRSFFLYFAALFLLCSACQRPSSSQRNEEYTKNANSRERELYNDYWQLLQAAIPDTTPIKNWEYDPSENSLNFSAGDNKAGALSAYNHKLYLAFKKPILRENAKTLRLSPNSPFGHLEKEGAYIPPFLVNGNAYSGVLIGVDQKSGERILEVMFYEGIRVHDFRIRSSLGRWHQRSFADDMPELFDMGPVRKPVLYCYPEQAQEINLQVAFKGTMTHSYPQYPEGGWTVWATPDGTLQDVQTGQTYPYLFWEGESPYAYALDEGSVVAGERSAAFLEQQLAHLGLNRREATDFITYWLPELEQSPYNLIHFSTTAYAEQAPLSIVPAPETLIRVFMVYQPLETPVAIPPQTLPKAERQGYTVVEWGGKRANRSFLPNG